MIRINKILISCCLIAFAVGTGCTKLDESLNDTLDAQQFTDVLGPNGPALLLKTAYADLAGPLNDVEQLGNLADNSTDEQLVPTRGGDWDDNGKWRSIHAHTWDANTTAMLLTFNSLNKINFDATNVLNFNPSPSQEAQARFLRAYALYTLLDLYGQYPVRDPGEDLRNPPRVLTGVAASDFIISELTAALPNLPAAVGNLNYTATPDAARFLLMRTYLNKGAFANRAAPTFADADMQQVITLGNQLMTSGRYSFTPEYYDNFSAFNQSRTREAIFAYDNTAGASATNADVRALYLSSLHYNSYTAKAPNAGWNGFSSVAEFYNTFAVNGATATQTSADTALDKRLGGRYYQGVTNVSGIRPGLLIGSTI